MRLMIFSVRDRATDSFGVPMFMVSRGQAIRSFSDEVNRQAADNQIFAHPEDFDLYELGEWSNGDGLFVSNPPELVAIGKDLRIGSA